MLQKEYNELRDKFLADVKRLNFKFPIVALAEKMRSSKSHVSGVLGGKVQPSEKFLINFYETFKDDLNVLDSKESSNHLKDEPAQYTPPPAPAADTVSLREHYEMLLRHYDDMKATKDHLLNIVANLSESIKEVKEVKENLTLVSKSQHIFRVSTRAHLRVILETQAQQMGLTDKHAFVRIARNLTTSLLKRERSMDNQHVGDSFGK